VKARPLKHPAKPFLSPVNFITEFSFASAPALFHNSVQSVPQPLFHQPRNLRRLFRQERDIFVKKAIVLLLAAAAALAAGLYFRSVLREAARPFLPTAAQQLLPGAAQSGGAAADKAGGKRGGGTIVIIAASAETATMPLIERTFGLVKSPAVSAVNARMASQITEIHVKDGQMVKAGDLLISRRRDQTGCGSGLGGSKVGSGECGV
jgi:hypothetical protein